MIWKSTGLGGARAIFAKKYKVRKITLLDIYYTAIVVKAAWYWG